MKLSSFKEIVRALDGAEVRYLVVGGLAVIAHGYGRTTYDVDLVIQLEAENIRRAFDALEGIDYRPTVPITAEQFSDPELRASWQAEKGMLVLKFWSDLHKETRLDVFVTEPFPFEAELRQAVPREVAPGLFAPVVGLETLLEMKRTANRLKDLADIDELNLLYGKPSSYDRPVP